ncbi:membrane-associated phospholipid phosphatase [Paenibacillus baekrokdamisoli]|nr:phosphatase PAP2 family protein [Paenibacillus baekrokdamisoli]MBB3067532.1 membrane-associated phospholipid phosphatase [Paenibacillus baekrokdamisoli]
MRTVSIYSAITVTLLIWYGAASNPFRIGGLFLKEMVLNRKYMLHFVALMLILFCNKLELQIESTMTVTYDYAAFFHSIEGNFVKNLQDAFHNKYLTTFLGFMYVIVFQALLIASIAIYTFQSKDRRMFYAVCYAVMIIYLVAIPFYLFLPVNEVWAYDPTVQFLMVTDHVFPNFESQYRALSGIDNCFPSLHTAISVTLSILAVRSGNKRWAWFCCTSAAIIIFSIFYLGIHWLIDMCGGVLLGVLASTIAMRLSSAQFSLRRSQRTLKRSNINYVREDAK